jgi:hypothetical protein
VLRSAWSVVEKVGGRSGCGSSSLRRFAVVFISFLLGMFLLLLQHFLCLKLLYHRCCCYIIYSGAKACFVDTWFQSTNYNLKFPSWTAWPRVMMLLITYCCICFLRPASTLCDTSWSCAPCVYIMWFSVISCQCLAAQQDKLLCSWYILSSIWCVLNSCELYITVGILQVLPEQLSSRTN